MTNQPTKLEVNTAETTPGESGDKSWVSGHNWLLFWVGGGGGGGEEGTGKM
jgi:hypothetical protein